MDKQNNTRENIVYMHFRIGELEYGEEVPIVDFLDDTKRERIMRRGVDTIKDVMKRNGN